MRDPKAPTELRVQVARAAAPLVHAKQRTSSEGRSTGLAAAFTETEGFVVDREETRALRDIQHRLAAFMRKRYGPRENGGPLTAAEIAEEAVLSALLSKTVGSFICAPGYGTSEAIKDSNRLHQLRCKRLSPPSCGGGDLKGAEDEEEAILTAKVAAYRRSPEGRGRERLLELTFQGIGEGLNADEEHELDQLKAKYPEGPIESPLAKAIALRLLRE